VKAVDPGRFQRIESLFDQVADLEPAERASALALHCADDPALAREVAAMFVEDAEPTRWQRAVGASSRSLIEASERRVVGGYRVLHEIGHGGMATVFLGERADGAFRRLVALKLLRGFPDAESLRRMRREREMLALLQHPGIALLLDGGETPEGQPYLVMEYVQGERLDHYCDARGLSVASRIAVFVRMAEAIAYAHRQLVVHGDIKPANVLVGAEGQVKVLDFGIGRVLDAAQPEGADTVSKVRFATPDYASPEQQAGARVSIAGDVYCLGRVLAELLAGRVARGERRATRMSDWTGIADAAASRGLEPVALRRTLRGDLDAIVARACEEDPAARYPDVPALIDDLVRYLDRRPVRARRAGRWYATAKWLRRHGLKLALSVLVGGVVLVAGTRYLIDTRRAAIEARITRGITSLARDSFIDIGSDGSDLGAISARDFWAVTTRRIERNSTLEPLVRTRFLFLLGLSRGSLGDMANAHSLIDRAVALRSEQMGRFDTECARMMASGAQLALNGRDLANAQARLKRLQAVEPGVYPVDAEDEIERTSLEGQVLAMAGDLAAGERALRAAHKAAAAFYPAGHYRIGPHAYRLASLLFKQGTLLEARELAEAALRTHLTEFGADSLQAKQDQRLIDAIAGAAAK